MFPWAGTGLFCCPALLSPHSLSVRCLHHALWPCPQSPDNGHLFLSFFLNPQAYHPHCRRKFAELLLGFSYIVSFFFFPFLLPFFCFGRPLHNKIHDISIFRFSPSVQLLCGFRACLVLFHKIFPGSVFLFSTRPGDCSSRPPVHLFFG